MRIGIDMLAMQSPHHGHRGIGRYGASLVKSMLDRDDEHEYVLYVHDGLSTSRIPKSSRATVREIRPRWHRGETMTPTIDRLVSNNPDQLDVFLATTPFEQWCFYAPPAKPQNGPRMACIIYDLIPFLFQNENEPDPLLDRHYHVLEELTRYDALLTISEATRRDVFSVLRLPPQQVVNISAASDPAYFVPKREGPLSSSERRPLQALGINKPFLFNVGGLDSRKNAWTLIDAFAALPENLRRTHQLVMTFWTSEWGRTLVDDYAESLGLGDALILTGEVSDSTLRRLYQQCEAFIFPSAYEGFGLPLLEAMHCGAAVIAGNNSSQIEVVGDAGLLVNASDVGELTAKITRILTEPELKQTLGERAQTHASRFSWEYTAERALGALTDTLGVRKPRLVRFDAAHHRKPTIAFFSPFPPRKSGISDYSAHLLEELRHNYRIDLIHDAGYVPEPALASAEFMACDYRLFDRIAAAKDYHAIVYQMGNSRYHHYMYDILPKHRGVVTLHDFSLAGFHLHYGYRYGRGVAFLHEELQHAYPSQGAAIEDASRSWTHDWGAIARDCSQRGWHLNRRVIDSSVLTIVHSPWCARQVEELSPADSDKILVIPHGARPRQVTDAERAAIRERFGIGQDAFVVGSFGFVHPDKLLPEALVAFAEVTRTNDRALYIIVGEEADGGEVRRCAARVGLAERTLFLGRQPAEAFTDLILVTDMGVNLRLPPTNGETSGALLHLLAAGVPTVVSDVGTFSDYPAGVVRKVHWETEGQPGLTRAIVSLAGDAVARESLRRAAWSYVESIHEWSQVAKSYVSAIEHCHKLTRTDGSRGRNMRLKTTAWR